jgi:glycosyltransferase involved in cell wall biosynthesis
MCANGRHVAQHTVLVVTDRTLDGRTRSGNRQRILSLLGAFRRLDLRVVLVAPKPIGAAFLARCDAAVTVTAPTYLGGEVSAFDPTPWFPAVRGSVERWRPDAMVTEYAWMAPCLQQAPPGTVRIVDTHDVLHARTATFAAAGLDSWLICSPQTESRLLELADVVLAIQHRERALLAQLLGDASRVVFAPHGVELAEGFAYQPSRGSRLLFVGGNHDGNLGIQEFVLRVLPDVRCRVASELDVYGAICQRLLPVAGCTLHGSVDDLREPYDNAALSICPLTAGSGAKIKLLESLGHGRTAVVTPQAIDGLPAPDELVWSVARDSWQFREALCELLADNERRHAMEQAARRYAERFFSAEQLAEALATALAKDRR